jgi:hypothetical protein
MTAKLELKTASGGKVIIEPEDTALDTTLFIPAVTGAMTVIPIGTKMVFVQTAAPTGWTKDTTHDNKALRVVSGTAGTGGTVNFTTAFASRAVSGTVGNHTLTIAQIPSHSHLWGANTQTQTPAGAGAPRFGTSADVTSSTGGGGAHSHTFTGTAIDLEVQYVDVIIATKD